MLEPAGRQASCTALASAPWAGESGEPGLGGTELGAGGSSGRVSGWKLDVLGGCEGSRRQLGVGWGREFLLLQGEVSLQKVRSKQQIPMQKNAASHILQQLIFFWRVNHCSFEKGTKEISLTSFSASLQYSVHQMCPVYQKIQMLQLPFGIT